MSLKTVAERMHDLILLKASAVLKFTLKKYIIIAILMSSSSSSLLHHELFNCSNCLLFEEVDYKAIKCHLNSKKCFVTKIIMNYLK